MSLWIGVIGGWLILAGLIFLRLEHRHTTRHYAVKRSRWQRLTGRQRGELSLRRRGNSPNQP